MRFSKKLLTALLPIAATGAIVPAVTSCNKGNGYVINFGDEVNCLDEKAKNYHSVNDVKNAIKNRVSIESATEILFGSLPNWTYGTKIQRQMMYFDFIASLSVVEGLKFHLTFDETASDNNFTLIYLKDGKEITAKSKIISYNIYSPEKQDIAISLQDTTSGDWVKCHSYAYKNTTIV